MKPQNDTSTTTGRVDPDVLEYTVGDDVKLDRALVKWDALGTAAHVAMLSGMPVEPPIVTKEEALAVKKALAETVAEFEVGTFSILESDQDVHMAVERRLTEKLGDLGKKIHTGRSRNDQVAVDVRLHIKSELLALGGEALDLVESLVRFAKKYETIPLAGRTHLQPAMPSSVGVWGTGHAENILDQFANLRAAYAMNDASPLGSAAGYGVPLPLDRAETARLLGFSRTMHNVFAASMGRGADEAALLSALAQLMAALSRLAEDMILFSMPEFGYFRLPRNYCTGSSIMPQKYNPDVLELVRSKTAQILGLATASLSLLHAMPGGYNRDLQDTKPLYMQGLSTVRTTLRIMAKVVDGMEIDEARLRAGFIPGVFATDAALRLVAAGVPWREAYHDVRDHLERLETEDADAAIAAKTHEGATAGLDWGLYARRTGELREAIDSRSREFEETCAKLLEI